MRNDKIPQEIICYDETNLSDNPLELIDQDTESIMIEMEASHATAEDNV